MSEHSLISARRILSQNYSSTIFFSLFFLSFFFQINGSGENSGEKPENSQRLSK